MDRRIENFLDLLLERGRTAYILLRNWFDIGHVVALRLLIGEIAAPMFPRVLLLSNNLVKFSEVVADFTTAT